MTTYLQTINPDEARSLAAHASKNDRWEFWKDKRHKWRWRRIASNGNIVGSSSMGYYTRRDCERNAARHGCV